MNWNTRSVRRWDYVTRSLRGVGRVLVEQLCRGAVMRLVVLEVAACGCRGSLCRDPYCAVVVLRDTVRGGSR